MKMIKNFLYLFLPLLFLSSCVREYEEIKGEIQLNSPTLNPLAENLFTLSRPEGDEDPFVVRLSWSSAKYSHENGEYASGAPIEYIVEMDLGDGDFSSAIELGTTSELYMDLFTKELKAAVDSLRGEELEEPGTFQWRVRAESTEQSVVSEQVLFTLGSYLLTDPTLKRIYLIGDMNGWDPFNTDYLLFRNSNDYKDKEYTYTGYFPKATYFKMVSEEHLGGYDQMYCAGENGTLVQGDFGAFYVDAGYYTITIDTEKNTWEIQAFEGASKPVFQSLGPIGGFSGWDNEPQMTQSSFDPHQWNLSYEFTESTAVKFRADRDWSKNWGGGDLDIPYGLGVFDGPGASLSEPGVYRIYFNDLTGHYALLKEE